MKRALLLSVLFLFLLPSLSLCAGVSSLYRAVWSSSLPRLLGGEVEYRDIDGLYHFGTNGLIRQNADGSLTLGSPVVSGSRADGSSGGGIPAFDVDEVIGGTFQMGAWGKTLDGCDSDEKPAHSVTVSTFWIGRCEVTQGLWEAIMGSNPSYFKGANLPVEQVSWDDCRRFLERLNNRKVELGLESTAYFDFPTEAEWEYAARGGNKSQNYRYSGSDDIGAVAWYYNNSGSQTHPVGQKRPNELGLYDMSGNVWEWCRDWYGSYSSSSQTNPTGAASGSYRVLRGGSWDFNAQFCRVSDRDYFTPDSRNYFLGLRLVLRFP